MFGNQAAHKRSQRTMSHKNQRQLQTLNRDIQANQAIINNPKANESAREDAEVELGMLLAEREELYASVCDDVRAERKQVAQKKRSAIVDNNGWNGGEWSTEAGRFGKPQDAIDKTRQNNLLAKVTKRAVLPLLLLVLAPTQACMSQSATEGYTSGLNCPNNVCKTSERQLGAAVWGTEATFHLKHDVWTKGFSVFNLVDKFVGNDDVQVLMGVDAIYTVADRDCPFDTSDGNVSLLHTYMHAGLLLATGGLDMGHKDVGWAQEASLNETLSDSYCPGGKYYLETVGE